jgi:type II secretory pathway predicted ATPase ExeA
MDRDSAVGTLGGGREHSDPLASFALPSRAEARAIGCAALQSNTGPVLITGEPGIGKTWLWQRLADTLPLERPTLAIDLTPATDPRTLFGAIAHQMGWQETGSACDPRLRLADMLAESTADGRRWVLVLDEAHTASDAVLEEVRIVSNRIGGPDGFSALVVVGQSRLARRLVRQPLLSLESRLAAHIHLRPIDADESYALLSTCWPERAWSMPDVERLHRDAAGNPKRLLRLAGQMVTKGAWPAHVIEMAAAQRNAWEATASAPQSAAPSEVAQPVADASDVAESTTESPPAGDSAWTSSPPLLGAAKPPLRDEEGLIEVGWEPTPADRPATASSAPIASGSGVTEEAVDDHYAALQAWNEWARNEGRAPSSAPSAPAEPFPSNLIESAQEPASAGELEAGGHIWADGPDRFAPYSQLFSRLKPSKDAD